MCFNWSTLVSFIEIIMSKGQEEYNQLENYEERKKKWYLDVQNTPCARNALIHGILGGFVVGFLYFARTNVIRKSCDWAVGGFGVFSIGSWEICRMHKAKQRTDVKRTVQVLNSLNTNSKGELHVQPPVDSSSTAMSASDSNSSNVKTGV